MDPQADNSNGVLSPAEAEAFSEEASAAASALAAEIPPASKAPLETAGPRPFDFRAPSFLTVSEQRQIRLRCDEWTRSLMARLSIYLRLEFGARVIKLETLTYRRFAERLAASTHLSLFKVDVLNGVGILDIPPSLGMAIVDRLLGGPGQTEELQRGFSEIEIEVLDLIVPLILKEWCQEVVRHAEAQPEVLSHESNPRFLRWSNHADNMLLATVEATLNQTVGEVKLAVPAAMLEPVIRQLKGGWDPKPTVVDFKGPGQPRWHTRFDDVPVPLNASWVDLEITARELSQLRVGDVLQISPAQASQVQVCVSNIPKFHGRLGTRGESWAIELNEVL